jgi:hypothetical protein
MDKTIILVILPEIFVKLELIQTNALLNNDNSLYVVELTNLETRSVIKKGLFNNIKDAINKFDEVLKQRRAILI